MKVRRGVGRVYHHEYATKRRSSYSSASKEEYKRRMSKASPEQGQSSQGSSRRTDSRLDEEYAEGNLLLGNFVIVVLSIDCLLGYIRYLNNTKSVPRMLQNTTFSYETSRKIQQILTDDVECSLLMKEALLQKYNIPMQMLFGLTCLALLVPYSVTPHSSISTMMYYLQKREALAESFRLGYITEECAVRMPPSTCHIRSQYKYMQGYVDLLSGLKDSSLEDVWKSTGVDKAEAFKWLYRSYSYETASNSTALDGELLLRKFRRPKALKDAMKFYDISSKYINNGVPRIVITEDIARNLVEDILPVKSNASNLTATLQSAYRFCAIPLLPYTSEQHYEVRFPCRDDQPTSSIISSFIVRVVRELMLRSDFERGYMDAGFHALLLHAHRYAEYLIAEHEATATDPETKLPKLLLEQSISQAVSNILIREKFSAAVVRRVYERVATGIIWRFSKHETILMVNLGMNNNVRASAQLLSSAAGLMVIDKRADDAPIIVASASGSVRTVEAVASVVLRMLMFDEEPGAAIHANATFYDTERLGFYCENTKEEFLSQLKEKHDIECSPLEADNFTHTDRIAMAIRRRIPNGRLVAAVDRRANDFNYAVGL